MRLSLIAVQLAVAALVCGAAVLPAPDETADAAKAMTQQAERTGKALTSRTMDPVLVPFDQLSKRLNTKKPLKIDQFHLDKVKDFALTHKDSIVWAAVASIAVVALALLVSLFTGFDGVFRSFTSGVGKVRARADDLGLKFDADHLNLVTSRVFQAIDTWDRENVKDQ